MKKKMEKKQATIKKRKSQKILARYSYNVPSFKTFYHSISEIGGRGGRCPRLCADCAAKIEGLCNICDFIHCPDIYCKGSDCDKCALMCARAGDRLANTLDMVGGLAVNVGKTDDRYINYGTQYIPAINRRIGRKVDQKIISIPFYALYDFQKNATLCSDIHDYFHLDTRTEIIINFYFKDDKICALFELMQKGKFIDLLKSYRGAAYWHTPCFSVFAESSGMDILLNFKRQFWIGDLMRDAGFRVIQEVLYSIPKQKTLCAGPMDALEVIIKKGIKNVSQCGQLYDFIPSDFQKEIPFFRGLPQDVSILITGLNPSARDAHRSIRPDIVFCDYVAQYSHTKSWNKYVNERR